MTDPITAARAETRHATFTIERTYPKPPTKVFAAFADPQAKRRWFAEGEGWTIEDFAAEFRTGGWERSRFRFQGGPPIMNDTQYHDIVADRRIVFTYVMTVGETRISASLGTFMLESSGGGTRLTYTEQAAFLDGQDQEAARVAGWRGLLDQLGAALQRDAA